jgi:hypothetical protein
MPITVSISSVENANQTQQDFIMESGRLLAKALRDAESFAAAVKAATYKQSKFKDSAGKVRDLNPDEIARLIIEGREPDQQGSSTQPDRDTDLKVRLYPHKKGTVGSTRLRNQPVKPAFWFVDRCIASKDGVSMARHLMHEWLHVVGFFHYPNNSARDDVPYVVGDIVRKRLKDKSLFRGDRRLEEIGTENELTAYLWEEGEEDLVFD